MAGHLAFCFLSSCIIVLLGAKVCRKDDDDDDDDDDEFRFNDASTQEGHLRQNDIQSTLVISKSKGLTEILRDIRTLTYQG